MEDESIKKYWKDFNKIYWTFFLVKIVSTGIVAYHSIAFFYYLQFVAIAGLIATVGYYCYKISDKKKYLFLGIFGIPWFGFLGTILGWLVVERIESRELKKII